MIYEDAPFLMNDVNMVNLFEANMWCANAIEAAATDVRALKSPFAHDAAREQLLLAGVGFSSFIAGETRNLPTLHAFGIAEVAEEWYFRSAPRLDTPSHARARFEAFRPIVLDFLALGMVAFRGFVSSTASRSMYSNVIKEAGKYVAVPNDMDEDPGAGPITMSRVHPVYGALYFAQEAGGNLIVGGVDKALRVVDALAPVIAAGFVTILPPGNPAGSRFLLTAARAWGEPIKWKG